VPFWLSNRRSRSLRRREATKRGATSAQRGICYLTRLRRAALDDLQHIDGITSECAVVASGVRIEGFRQITLCCLRSQDAKDAVEVTTVIHPRNAAWAFSAASGWQLGKFVAQESSSILEA
jgi:hypothetical protein